MFSHRFKFIFPGLLGVYSFLNILILDGDRLYQAALPEAQLFTLILILCYTVWLINWSLERFLSYSFKNLHPLLTQFLGSFVLVAGLAALSVQTTSFLFGGPFGNSLPNFLLTLGFLFRINLFLNCVNAIYFFFKKFTEKKLEADKLRLLSTEAKLESLNSQLNPHFFFNNLSALSVLIHQDVGKADQYLQKLSATYRYILQNKVSELVNLKDELVFLEDYIELLQIRFQDSLSFNFSISEKAKNKLIPPAVLQLLVENVVKHNYFTKKEPLIVQISADDQSISVGNVKQLKEAVEDSTGIGLKNISDRYRFLNQSIRITDQKDWFEVVLPLLETHEDTFSRRRTFSSRQNQIDH